MGIAVVDLSPFQGLANGLVERGAGSQEIAETGVLFDFQSEQLDECLVDHLDAVFRIEDRHSFGEAGDDALGVGGRGGRIPGRTFSHG